MPPGSSSNKKVANSLVAISSAAVLTVYAAGFMRTKAAAEKFAEQSSDRRPRRAPVVTTASLNVAPPMTAALPVQPEVSKPAAKVETAAPVVEPKAKKMEAAPTTVAAPVATPVAVAAPVVAAAPVASAAPTSPPAPWKDGTWKGWGNCRHGDIQAAVVIEGGKITSATIVDCQTRYSCDIIDKLPPQVVKRQSANIDTVGGATQSGDAYYYAVYEGLRQAAEAAKAEGVTAPATPPAAN